MQILTKLYNGTGAFVDVSSILPSGVPAQAPKRVVFVVPVGSAATIKNNSNSGGFPAGEGVDLTNTTGVQPYAFTVDIYDDTETSQGKLSTFNSLQMNVALGRTLNIVFFW